MTDRQNHWPVAVRFGGLGGQGLITLGAVLAEAGAGCGLRVAASQSYGSQARGGATRADVILSAEYIDFPHVHAPDVLVVLAQEAFDLFAPGVEPGGMILADSFFVKGNCADGVKMHSIDSTDLALERVGNKVSTNFVMLGAMLGYTNLVDSQSVHGALKSIVRPRWREVNAKALDVGLEVGRDLLKEVGPWR